MPQKIKLIRKNPCPDCNFCQWCSDERCNICRHPVKKGEKKKPHKPLFLKY